MSKIGLVLSGGGAKGAYQAGCIRALAELGLKFDAVSGTSIGALNGSVVACSADLQSASEIITDIWQQLGNQPPLKLGTREMSRSAAQQAMRLVLRQNPYLLLVAMFSESSLGMKAKRQVYSLLESCGEEGDAFNQWVLRQQNELTRVDTALLSDSPIKTILDDAVSPQKLIHGLPFYVGVYESKGAFADIGSYMLSEVLGFGDTRAADFIHIQNLALNEMRNAVLASAAIPLLFSRRGLADKVYSDGGIGGTRHQQGNTPAQPLVDKQCCSHLVVSHLSDGSTWDRNRYKEQTIIELRPRKSLKRSPGPGGELRDMLAFNEENISSWMAQGYEETLQQVGKIKEMLELWAQGDAAEQERDSSVSRMMANKLEIH